MSNYIDNLKTRYATKMFDSSYIISEELENLLDQTLNLAPSSYGLQPYKIVKVKGSELKQKLREVSWDQAQVTDCSIYYILCARTDIDTSLVTDYVLNIANTRSVSEESLEGYKQMMNGAIQSMSDEQKIEWSKKQAYIVLGFLLDACAQNNLDACPMEGYDSTKYDEILGLKELGLTSAVACAVGKRSKEDVYADLPKVRLNINDLIINK